MVCFGDWHYFTPTQLNYAVISLSGSLFKPLGQLLACHLLTVNQ